MGANSSEYEKLSKTKAEKLAEEQENHWLSKKYSEKFSKLAIPGALAPILGSAAGSALADEGKSSLADYATMGGSALGALAAPIAWRNMDRTSIKDVGDISTRSKGIKKGESLSVAQVTDSALSAGKSMKNASMVGMAGAYGYGALTGNMMDPAAMALGMKVPNALSNPGSAAFLGGNILSDANYLGGVGETHMAALPGKALEGIGGMIGKDTGIGSALMESGSNIADMTGFDGSAIGMISYMMATMLGSKAMSGIKSKANKSDKKFNYKSADLGKKASSDIQVQQYDGMGSAAAQINLLNVTGQLTPAESLTLQYLQSIDKHSSHLNAIFDLTKLLVDKDGDDETFITHNEILDLVSEGQNTDFTTTNDYKSTKKIGAVQKKLDNVEEWYENLKIKTHEVSTDFNSLFKVGSLTGSIFGKSGSEQIKTMYGMDEESKLENAQVKTAKELNIPTNMVVLAEMKIGSVLKTSDTIEGKQLAIQTFSASLLQSMLQLDLDSNNKDSGGDGFFNKTQSNLDASDKSSNWKDFKDKGWDKLGTLPILGSIAGWHWRKEGIKKRESEKKEELELYNSEVDSGITSVDELSLGFMETQFPSLYLNNLDLDKERNIWLEKIFKKSTDISKTDISKTDISKTDISKTDKPLKGSFLKLSGTEDKKELSNTEDKKELTSTEDKKTQSFLYDALTGTFKLEKELVNSYKETFSKNIEDINKYYEKEIKDNPKNKEFLQSRRNEEIETRKNQLQEKYSQSNGIGTSLQDSQDAEAKEEYDNKMLEAFEGIVVLAKEKEEDKDYNKTFWQKRKENAVSVKDKAGGLMSSLGNLKGSTFGKTIGNVLGAGASLAKTFLPFVFKSILTTAMKYKKASSLAVLAGAGYLASEYLPTFSDSIDKVQSGIKLAFGKSIENENGSESYSNTQIAGFALSGMGSMIMSLPAPHAKGVGAVMMMLGAGMSADWKAIIQKTVQKLPFIGDMLGYVLSDEKMASMGLDKKGLKDFKIKEDMNNKEKVKYEHDKKRGSLFVGENTYDKKGLTYKLLKNVDKDNEHAKKLREIMGQLDIKHDGKIDEEDRLKDTKRFDKLHEDAQKEIKALREDTAILIQSLNSKPNSDPQKLNQMQIQTSMLSLIADTLKSNKTYITSVTKDKIKGK